MVDQQLGVDAKESVQQYLVPHRLPRHIAHREHVVGFEFSTDPFADAPEIRQRTVIPKVLPVGKLVQFRDANAVLVRRNMLGVNIHGDLAKIEIAADPCRGGNAGGIQHILHDHPSKVVGAHAAGLDIIRSVHEYLVNGIDVHIIHRNILEVNVHDPRAVFHVVGHAGCGDDVVQLQRGIIGKLLRVPGLSFEHMARCMAQALGVDFFHTLHNLEQTCAAGDTIGLQRW